LGAADQFHGQYAPSAQVAQRGGHQQFRVVGQAFAEPFEVVGFKVVVEFGQQGLAELVDPVGEAQAAADAGAGVGAAGNAGKGVEVGADVEVHARSLHFHSDLAAV